MSLRTSRAVRMTSRDGAVRHAEHGPGHAADALASWGSVSKVMVAAVARDPYGPYTDARFDDEVLPRLASLVGPVRSEPD